MESVEINSFSILKKATSSSEALNQLYIENKALNQKFSLGYLCQQSGIPSKGYLGDVFKGRRILNRKYNSTILENFNLADKEKRILELLLEYDQEENQLSKKSLAKLLSSAIKSYQVKEVAISDCSRGHLIAILFSCFGLVENTELKDFHSLLPRFSMSDIKLSLQELINMKLVELNGTTYSMIEEDVMCNTVTEHNIEAQISFLESAIDYAKNNLTKKYLESETNYFQSTVLSVKKEDLPKFIKDLKLKTNESIAGLESSQGDDLLHLNIQVFTEK